MFSADRLGEFMNKQIQSDFLFARPSFASGAASTFDLWGQLTDYNSSATPAEADANAIFSDWAITGQDIFDAIEQCASECDAA
jgi:hypothetical protein